MVVTGSEILSASSRVGVNCREGLEQGTEDALSPTLVSGLDLSVPQVWTAEAKTDPLISSKH